MKSYRSYESINQNIDDYKRHGNTNQRYGIRLIGPIIHQTGYAGSNIKHNQPERFKDKCGQYEEIQITFPYLGVNYRAVFPFPNAKVCTYDCKHIHRNDSAGGCVSQCRPYPIYLPSINDGSDSVCYQRAKRHSSGPEI